MGLYAEDIRDMQKKMNTAIDNLEEPIEDDFDSNEFESNPDIEVNKEEIKEENKVVENNIPETELQMNNAQTHAQNQHGNSIQQQLESLNSPSYSEPSGHDSDISSSYRNVPYMAQSHEYNREVSIPNNSSEVEV